MADRDGNEGSSAKGGKLRSRRLVVGGVIVAAAVVVLLYARRPHREVVADAHRESLQATSDVYMAALHAAEGSTPCESAFNAFQAMAAAADEHQLPPPLPPLPSKELFVTDCGGLAPEDQQCLVPRYQVRNRDTCEPRLARLRGPDGSALAALFAPQNGVGGPASPVVPPTSSR